MVRQQILTTLFCFTIIATHLFGQTQRILIDFGSVGSPAPWNNIDNPHGETTALTDLLGNQSGYSISVVDSFNFINTNGTTQPSSSLGLPASATSDSFFGNIVEFSGDTQPTGAIRLNNLDPSIMYTLKIFASRLASDNRETLYTILGSEEKQLSLNVADNSSEIVVTTLNPSATGTLDLSVTAGSNNTNPNGFFYLGAMILEYTDPNFEEELTVISPNGGEYWQIGKSVTLQFTNSVNEESLLEYSTDDGVTWIEIGNLQPLTSSYSWTIPNTASENCIIKVTTSQYSDLSDSTFTIADDTDSCPIVVIGSSTAEGIGATVQDSAWVYRYDAHLYQNDTRYPVINLGRGGYTTYHLLPTGSTSGESVGISVDIEKNITKALSYHPASIIINLPSNDAANFIAVQDQMNNFREMTNAAKAEGVSSWVCTTQPRNFGDAAQITLQTEARDSIFNYYGEQAIDFWNPIADQNGNILAIYNSGDGVHLNDSGHSLLYEIVKAIEIPSLTSCNAIETATTDLKSDSKLNLFTLSPNPTDTDVIMTFNQDIHQLLAITITALDGKSRELPINRKALKKGDSMSISELNLNALESNLLFVHLEVENETGHRLSEIQPLLVSRN